MCMCLCLLHGSVGAAEARRGRWLMGTGVTGGCELHGQVLGTGLEFPMRETFHC